MVSAVQSMVRETLAAVTEEVSAELPWPEAVADAIAATLPAMARRPAFTMLGLVEAPVASARSYYHYRRGVGDLVARLDRTRDPGRRDLVPGSAGRAAIGDAEALIVDALLAGRAARLPGLLPDVVFITFVPYLGRAEALRETEAARVRHRGRATASGPHPLSQGLRCAGPCGVGMQTASGAPAPGRKHRLTRGRPARICMAQGDPHPPSPFIDTRVCSARTHGRTESAAVAGCILGS